MRRSKIFIFTFLFAFIGLLFCGLKVDATTSTSNLISVQGAQVRTSGTAGIRFVGNIDASYDKTNVTAYGISIAFGEANNIDDLVIGGTVNGKSVLSAQVSSLDGTKYYINLTDIPESMYGQKVTSRAYVVDNGDIIYSDTLVTRSLGQVTLAVKAAGDKSDLIDEIYSSLNTNYKKVHKDSNGNVFVTSSIYETDPVKLEKEFVSDWNSLFSTDWSKLTYSTFQASAVDGTTPITANEDSDGSGTNIYKFFITNEETANKWGWLLDYLFSVGTGKVHPKRQINALLNGGSYNDEGYTNGTYLWMFKHLTASIVNFFQGGNAAGRDFNNNDIEFNLLNMYISMLDYNNKIYSINPDLVYLGKDVKLDSLTPEAGYNFDGYISGGGEYHDSYPTTEENYVVITPSYSPIEYTISYYCEDSLIDTLTDGYNIETEEFALPFYAKSGYSFKGWYTTPTFEEGTEVTKITTGTTGDLTFYAKMEVSEYTDVNVTYDLNGGNWYYGSYDEMLSDFLADFNSATGKSVTDPTTLYAAGNAYGTFYAANGMLDKWGWLVQFFYDLGEEGYGKNAEAQAQYQTFLAGQGTTVDVQWAVRQNIQGFFTSTKAAKYSTAAAIDFSDSTIRNKCWNVLTVKSEKNAVLNAPQTLPTPKKVNDTFVGWKSSLDSSVSVNYPGYSTNPGDITYTAVYASEGGSAEGTVDVNVTLDANGGFFTTPETSITVQKVANYAADITYLAPSTTTSTLQYQNKIILNYDSTLNVYKVVAIDKASKTLTNAANGAAWTHAIANSATDITANVVVGQYIYLDAAALATSAQTALVFSTQNVVKMVDVYNAATTLPTPTKEGYVFAGWQSSVDGSVVYKYPGYSTNPGDITYTAIYKEETSDISTIVSFDFNGGVSKELYTTNGTLDSTLIVSNYNGNIFSESLYPSNVFVHPGTSTVTGANFIRIHVGLNDYTGLYTVLSIQAADGSATVKPAGTEFTIRIYKEYSGTYDDNFDASKINAGDVVFFDKAISGITASNVGTFQFYNGTLNSEVLVKNITATSTLPTPLQDGYKFDGWYDSNDKKYSSVQDFSGMDSVTVSAKWIFEDYIIGEFEDQSWVVVGNTIQLLYSYVNTTGRSVTWTSKNPSIATVTAEGTVKGVSEGVATIVVSDSEYSSINFEFYVTVVATAPTGVLKVLLESNNTSIFTRDDLPIGAGTPAYYYDAVGSVSKLLFEDYVVHKDFYLSSPSNKSTLTGANNGVDFITFHYAADMPYSANYSLRGGYNLASYNKTCNTNGTGASWHYSTGNDGVWYCQNTAYGAWHAGSSKTMSWTNSGVTTAQVGTNVLSTDVTLGSDNYFYIKGVKTTIKNATGYSYTKFNKLGLGVRLNGTTWQLSGHYYNSSYGYICSVGGNQNSIGIESSVREGSDLWLTWQYSAQLCAKLLIQFNLPIQRLVGHHFFTGKDCPQPLLENNIEIWKEFVKLVEQEMAFYNAYGTKSISMSSNSSYVNSKGRVTSLPKYSECVTYTVTYTDGSTTKTITMSSILPGTVA